MLNKILCAAILGFFGGLGADAQTAPAPSAKVKGQIVAARVQGSVTAISNPTLSNRLLHDGDRLTEDSTIVTAAGASVILVFSNGATVEVAGDSRLKINEFVQDPFSSDLKPSEMKQETGTSKTRLYLTKGELVGRVAHLDVDEGSEFTVQTPVGAAGIRGTFFKCEFRPGKDHKAFISLQTFEGLIVFTSPGSGPVDISAGHKFEATVDFNPKDPDNPEDWVPPASLTVQMMFISPTEGAQFQSELQAILAALEGLTFHPAHGGGDSSGASGGNPIDPNAPPPPSPPLNPPTPGAGGP
jgi:hypothetical protein